ncbi:unnamed protein product [Meloidogyne enterolobii]|uniref:Uncharacterized protein n=1 Tax=Meloidogyne enterolobii TaxID=390850 RepID=A0ACB0YX97_MELEN
MKNSELLCRCNHDGCSREITDIAGSKYEGICRAHTGGQCRRMVHLGKDKKIKEVVLSCMHADQLVPKERPFVCQSVNTSQLIQIVKCCRDGSFCNDKKFSIETTGQGFPEITNDNDNSNTSYLYFLLLFAVSVLFSGFGLCVGINFGARIKKRIKKSFDNLVTRLRNFYNRRLRSTRNNNNLPMEEVYRVNEEDDEEYDQFITTDTGEKRKVLKKLIGDLERKQNPISTGSGAGMPILVQRTIAWQIILKDCIGRGRFGEVYMGEWRAEKVAVKIFLSRDEPSWQRETDIYKHNMLRHSNLLRWIGSDTKDAGSSTQLWLVTEYLPNGSLYDFLEQNKITLEMNIQFMRSIAHGLAYLHSELPGVNNQCHKPGIAHRDIKSRNILIKNDWTCCIADLGMAIRYGNGLIDIPQQDRGGTVVGKFINFTKF